jgi:NitT/TauT family transport system ATP-binding protein
MLVHSEQLMATPLTEVPVVAARTAAGVKPGGFAISLHGIRKQFVTHSGQTIPAIDRFDLDIEGGAFVAIVGPSGCGKSTLLNCVAGLDHADDGEIRIDGRPMGAGVTPGVGYMFQQDTLLPWYSVERNVELGLRYARNTGPEARALVDHLLQIAELSGVRKAFPSELSGGMRRRVALCAALAIRPRVLLMDEPFSALDTFTKASIQQYLLKFWEELRPTVLFVTHDLEEAVTVADRIVVMSRRPGRIKDIIDVAVPRPRDVYAVKESPAFVTAYQRTWHALGGEFDR